MDNQTTADIPSGSRRVKSRKFRMCMKRLLSLPVKDEQARNELLSLGLDGKDADNYMLVTLAVFKKAVGGDLKFIQELRQIISDNETEMKFGKKQGRFSIQEIFFLSDQNYELVAGQFPLCRLRRGDR